MYHAIHSLQPCTTTILRQQTSYSNNDTTTITMTFFCNVSQSAATAALYLQELSYGGSGIVTYRYISRMHLQ